jgi:hypothetical protein
MPEETRLAGSILVKAGNSLSKTFLGRTSEAKKKKDISTWNQLTSSYKLAK